MSRHRSATLSHAGVFVCGAAFFQRKLTVKCLIVMRIFHLVLSAMLLNGVAPLHAHAMAGDLKAPSLAMPEGTPDAFRTNVLAILGDKECKFLDGTFINASTTLHYGGSTESLNNLVAKLSELDGVRISVTFITEPGGP